MGTLDTLLDSVQENPMQHSSGAEAKLEEDAQVEVRDLPG